MSVKFESKSELKQWLIDKLNINGRSSLRTSITNSKTIQFHINSYMDLFSNVSMTYTQKVHHIVNDLYHVPVCQACQVKHPKFNNNKWGYLNYCSIKCQTNDPKVKDKTKRTLIEKYGCDNYAKTELFKEQMIKHNMKKYGVPHYQMTDEFKDKSKASMIKRYGISNYTKTDEFKEKFKRTIMERYGVEHYTKTDEYKEKRKQTCLLKYGVDHQMKVKSIKQKISNTMMTRYGCKWYTSSDEFMEKYRAGGKHKWKDYTTPSGKTIRVQGYEPRALDILFETFNEFDVFAQGKEISKQIGPIMYEHEGKQKRYYPDIYVKSKNLIIEVKSTWTINYAVEQNLAKRDACLQRGINFEFWIFDGKNFNQPDIQ